MNLRTLVPLAASVLLVAPAARAQSDTSEKPHLTALAFGLGPSPSIGLWRRVSPAVEAGVEVSGGRQSGETALEQEFSSSSVAITPAIKLFSNQVGPVLPYVYAEAGVFFGSSRSVVTLLPSGAQAEIESHDRGFQGGVGVGLQWFPVERVAIGGHAGVNGQWLRTKTEFEDADDTIRHSTAFGTFGSGVRVELYL